MLKKIARIIHLSLQFELHVFSGRKLLIKKDQRFWNQELGSTVAQPDV